MDICFLTCICLWQISQIQTCLFKVGGPGLVSTSLAFVSSGASHPAGPHGRHAQETVNWAPLLGAGKFDTIYTAAWVRCDSSTACRLCRSEPGLGFLTIMLKTALNTNIIPHIWKLANIVPIPKPNKDIGKGSSYRPISPLSVIAKTLEKSPFP